MFLLLFIMLAFFKILILYSLPTALHLSFCTRNTVPTASQLFHRDICSAKGSHICKHSFHKDQNSV
jgi:hypothetical protein